MRREIIRERAEWALRIWRSLAVGNRGQAVPGSRSMRLAQHFGSGAFIACLKPGRLVTED